MRFRAAKPRIIALVIAFIGFILVLVNHRTVVHERNYYPMLMLFGPVCILFGLAGAIEPRIMNRAGIQTDGRTIVFKVISIAIVLIGLGIGWAMAHFWYRIW
jgi:hypothetical protein